MAANFFTRLLSIGAGKQLSQFEGRVTRINAFEPEIEKLSDEALAAKTVEFRNRIERGETTDELLPEAFAVVREAGKRSLGMRHFDVQLIGGMALDAGQIAEMRTGEGKTLVATLAAYLNALPGKGVHVVTVNDYLAKRDSEWMGRLYGFLGMQTGIIQAQMDPGLRLPAYAADITYGTNAEFGFDYLRDNMVVEPSDRVQRGHYFAVVDEVDSILIDEARTPLIISGPGTRSSKTYKDFAKIIPRLVRDVDFEYDEAKKTIAPTEEGVRKVEEALDLDIYADPSGQLANHLQQGLKAQFMFHKDQEYVVADGEIVIVDEFTGRLMVGRRYSEGLHQAIEAKERVHVREENQTLATITLQNYFRMYDKLSGMTGTAATEESEFREIYKLGVMVIPTNRPMVRDDADDLIYRTRKAKYAAVVEDIAERHAAGQPCLVGTISIENSELLSRQLDKKGITHRVLNAKYHEREANIIALAGRLGAVTIATNMAGRGTDILLGGNPEILAEELLRDRGIDPEEASDADRDEALARARDIAEEEHEAVVAAGGLAVLGTERHEARRIDNQLRGRAGRQGDPGASRFYLSLEDDLLRLFGGDRMDRISSMMEKSQIPDDMPIEFGLVSKAIESAQRQVETMNFSARKHLLEYDDVMNKQREVIYAERNAILDGKDIHDGIEEIIRETIANGVLDFAPERVYAEEWDWDGLRAWFADLTSTTFERDDYADVSNPHELGESLADRAMEHFRAKETEYGEELMRALERMIMLSVIDSAWMEHLSEMDYLKEGIGMRAYGQRDPLVEYKQEAFDLFAGLVAHINETFVRTLMHAQLELAPEPGAPLMAAQAASPAGALSYSAPDEGAGFGALAATAAAVGGAEMGGSATMAAGAEASRASGALGDAKTFVKDKEDPFADVGRNDPCPCGSGKKFKKCHGAGA